MPVKSHRILFVCVLLSACRFSNRAIPLPQNDNEFTTAVPKPLKFQAAKAVRWNVVPADSIKPGQISLVDLNKVPSKPFNPEELRAFPKPLTELPLKYNQIPATDFDPDKIPAEPLVFKTSLLGVLKKSDLANPKVHTESFFTSFQYSDEQGLPGSNMQSILKTRDGLTWIGTGGNIGILNGQTMDVLPYNYGQVFSMAEDRFAQVWIRSLEFGVFVIDRVTGIQKQFSIPSGVNIRIDAKGWIWICCNRGGGLYIVNPEETTIRHITIKNGLGSNSLRSTIEDSKGRVWITSQDNGLDIYDPKTKKITNLNESRGLSNNSISGIAESSSGDIYIGYPFMGVDVLNLQKQTLKHIGEAQGFPKTVTYGMSEYEDGRIWFATSDAGVYILNKSQDSLIHLGLTEGLGDDATWFAIKIGQQMMVGTQTGGINVFPPHGEVVHFISKKQGLLDNDIWSFVQDEKKRIWMGTYAGVNVLTPDQKLLEIHPSPFPRDNRVQSLIRRGPGKYAMVGAKGITLFDETTHVYEKISQKEGMPTSSMIYVMQDHEGMLWIGTLDAGLIEFDPVKRTIRYLNQASGIYGNRIDCIVEDSLGRIVFTTLNGLHILNKKRDSLISLTTLEGLSNNQLGAIFRDSKDRLWLGSERGLNVIDPLKKTLTSFTISNGLPANGVYSMIEKRGQIYVGTGKGLTVISENPAKSNAKENPWALQTYGKAQGFSFMDFNGNAALVTQNNQLLWGIIQGFTVMDESVITGDSTIAPPEITCIDLMGRSQYFISPELISNVDTLWTENKDSFYLKGSFKTLNSDKEKGIEWDSLSSTFIPINLSLPPERNYLRFHFGKSLPQTEGYIKYRYILDGVDEKWNPVTYEASSENYNNVSPGYYTFRVAARKGTGPWSEPSVYRFRIRPPWWSSWWAELIYVLIAIGALRMWVSYRSRRLRKENARLELKVTERTNELTNSLENLRQAQGQLIQAEKMASLGELTAGIAHEIQNPLNFVNNFSEVNTELIEDMNKALDEGNIPETKEILKDVEMNMGKITFHGKRADAIVKGMLLHSRASSGQKIPTDVNALADEYLRLSYHGLRAKDKSFNAQFNMDFDQSLQPIMLVQQDVGRVLLNLFNNAFYSVTEKKKQVLNGYQPTVSVATKRKKDTIEIRIRDNGQGIPQKVIDKIYQPFFTTKPAGQGTGLGLSLSYDIITKEHSGKIDVVTKENEFTEFIIELPALPVS